MRTSATKRRTCGRRAAILSKQLSNSVPSWPACCSVSVTRAAVSIALIVLGNCRLDGFVTAGGCSASRKLSCGTSPWIKRRATARGESEPPKKVTGIVCVIASEYEWLRFVSQNSSDRWGRQGCESEALTAVGTTHREQTRLQVSRVLR